MRVSLDEMYGQFERVLLGRGFTAERAALCAKLFAEASLDGFFSHGLNRFPAFVAYIDKGYIDVAAEPVLEQRFGVLERWNGKSGPGNLNAHAAMNRAIAVAKEHGIGCVALSHTNHWMRAGSYGWQAAEAGCIGICWTNTMPNLPPWGAKDAKVGNNPLVMAVPRPDGHLVLDVAMSQFSYGQLGTYRMADKPLSVDGGYDKEGKLTRDASAILETKRLLPIGYWKGSGLAMMLDLIAALLSGGQTTHDIGRTPEERGVSQVFLAIDTAMLPDREDWGRRVEEAILDLHRAVPAEAGSGSVRYPGEDTLRRRSEHLRDGIPVEPDIWRQVQGL